MPSVQYVEFLVWGVSVCDPLVAECRVTSQNTRFICEQQYNPTKKNLSSEL